MRAAWSSASPADADRVHATTEGNPLFVDELLRVRGAGGLGPASMPAGLRAILDEHLTRVSPETLELLEIGSVLGRDVDGGALADLAERPLDDVDRALREAQVAGLLVSIQGANRLSFAHILLCERLRAELVPSRRDALHWRAGERIVRTRGDLATAAHHLLEGRGAGSNAYAAQIAEQAARAAMARLAFEDAAALCERALGALDDGAGHDELVCTIEIVLGEAKMRAGDVSIAREICARAAERAKAIGSVEKLASAALTYATEIVTGTIDPRMVALLRDAAGALGNQRTPLVTRVLARLAAALVPPRGDGEVTEVLALAERAMALARDLDDRETLLFALHYAGSARGYLVAAKERYADLEELISLSTVLDRPLVMLNAGGWWSAALREQGRVAEAAEARSAYARLLSEFPQPHYRCRLPMLHAMTALLDGDFERAEVLAEEGRAIAEEGSVRSGLVAWALLVCSIALVRDDPSWIAERGQSVRAVFDKMGAARNGFAVWHDAVSGRTEQARQGLPDVLAMPGSFPWALLAGETAIVLGDLAAAAKLHPALERHAAQNDIFWGPFGIGCVGPTRRIAGDVAALLGRKDAALASYQEALAIAERMQAPPLVAQARKRLAALAEPSLPRPAALASTPERIEIRRQGDVWHVQSSTGITVVLKDGKGLHYLEQLLACPGRELHVTQLAEAFGASADAPSVLDERAKASYRTRIDELRDAIEEAERFGDEMRAARGRVELTAIAEQLAAAVGLGGRDRKLGSDVERARINVQRRIRDAIQRIGEQDPTLGKYLARTVKTGVFCSFCPL